MSAIMGGWAGMGGRAAGRLVVERSGSVSVLRCPLAWVHHHRERDLDMRKFLGIRTRGRRPNRHRDESFREQRGNKFIQVLCLVLYLRGLG